MTDSRDDLPRDDLDSRLRPSVEPMAAPPGAFGVIRRRAHRRRWAQASSAVAAAAVLCFGGITGGLLVTGDDGDRGIVVPPPAASSPPPSPSPVRPSSSPDHSSSSPEASETQAEEPQAAEPRSSEDRAGDAQGTEPGTVGDGGPGGTSPRPSGPNDKITTCQAGDLAANAAMAGAAAGNVYWNLVFTNQSDASCSMNGYPTVVLVDGNEQPLPTSQHAMAPGPSRVVVAPGESASATVRTGNVRSEDQECQPPSEYASVTPRDASGQLIVSLQSRSCHGDISVSGLVEGDEGAAG